MNVSRILKSAEPDKVIVSPSSISTTGSFKCDATDEWRPQTSTSLIYRHHLSIIKVAISSKFVLATQTIDTIRLCSLSTGRELAKITCLTDRDCNPGLVFSADGTLLATVNRKPRGLDITVWDAETGAKLCRQKIRTLYLTDPIAFSADNKLFACCQVVESSSVSSRCTVYKLDTGRKVGDISPSWTKPKALSFVQGDQRLLCHYKNRIEMWDVTTWNLTHTYGASGFNFGIHVTQDLTMTCSNGWDEIRIIYIRSGKKKTSNVLGLRGIYSLACASGTREVAYAGIGGSIGIWDPSTGLSEQGPSHLSQDVVRIALSPDGRKIVYGTYDGEVWLWDRDS
jgi:WD40 repeat protein